jgi:hypothetical protein
MTRFMVLYRASTSAAEQMAKATPERARAGMEAWMKWAAQAGDAIVDLGSPLGETVTVTGDSVSEGRSDLGGYSILQAESRRRRRTPAGAPASSHARREHRGP